MSIKSEAKTLTSVFENKSARFYVSSEPRDGQPGTVWAITNNKAKTIIIPESITVKGKTYTVTKLGSIDSTPYVIPAEDRYNTKYPKPQKVVIPRTVTKLELGIFANFTNLKKIVVDKKNPKFKVVNGTLLSKNGKVLYDTIAIKDTYRVPKGVKRISSYAFAYAKVKKVVLPKSCTKIDARAFHKCKSLKQVTNLKSVKKIGRGAFYKTKMKNITARGDLK